MDLLKSVILSLFTLVSVFNTQPSSPKGSGHAVLGETTGFSSSKSYTLGQALGCDNEAACRDLCAKPENIQRCLQIYNSINASLEPTQIASPASSSNSSTRYYTGSTAAPAANPTMNPSQRQHYIQEIKTKLGCDYETTCRDVCSQPENKQHCTEVLNSLYLTIIRSGSSSSGSVRRGISPTPYLRQRTANLSPAALSQIKSEFQSAYQKIMATGGAERDGKLKALQQEYYEVMSHGENQAKASAEAVLRKVGEVKKTDASQEARLKERLMQIKNTTKRQLVQTIDVKIGSINEKAVTAMNTALDKLNALLGNLNRQLFALPSTTPDLALVETEAIDAQSAITDAQAAVLAQSLKTYPLSFSSDEAKLRSSIAPAVIQLTADIKRTHEAVVKARDAVAKVYSDTNRIKTNSGTAIPIGTGSAATP